MCISMAASVNETVSAAGVRAIMDFEFVPWGNAYYAAVTGNKTYDRGPGLTSWLEQCGMGKAPGSVPADCWSGPILCQHGPNECKGNLIEGCVMKLNPDNYWNFIACYEAPPDPSRTDPSYPDKMLKSCAAATGLDESAIAKCVADPTMSLAVSNENAKKTAALVPAHEGTPWVLINGKPFQGQSLLKAVCAAYTGVKPQGCA